MAYLPPHRRHSSSSEPAPTPSPPTSSLQSLSISSSSRGRHHLCPSNNKIIHAAGCVSRWSPLPPFPPGSDDAESFRLVPFLCDPIERKTGAKPLVLAASSPKSSTGSTEAAVAAIADRFFPDLLAAADRARATAHDGPTEDEEVKLSLVARVGKFLFQPGPSGGPVSLDSVRDAAKAGAEGSKSQVELNQIRQLVEDISCPFNDLDLRLMLSTKRILKNIGPEVEDAIKSLVSSAIVDLDAKGGLRWAFGNESIGERFSVVGVWHTSYKAFRNKTLRLKLRCADRFDHRSSTGEISNEITFKLTGISKRLQDLNHLPGS